MTHSKYIVITTINPPTKEIEQFAALNGWKVLLIGDRKTPQISNTEILTYLSIEDQRKLDYEIVELCPYDHYSRKNIGYLYALENGAGIIYDTDDDNFPYVERSFPEFVGSNKVTSSGRFVNIYSYFLNSGMWPRGYPLEEVARRDSFQLLPSEPVPVGAWQGMSDNEPDVDAIYRLTVSYGRIKFEEKPPVVMGKHNYCPFNSQNTMWDQSAFPYMYLPCTTSFRFTDILRGYVAQRLFWQEDLYLGFTGATVYQNRNKHNLMKDFADEIECYLHVPQVVELLEDLELSDDPLENIVNVYQMLSDHDLVRSKEVDLAGAWVRDVKRLTQPS